MNNMLEGFSKTNLIQEYKENYDIIFLDLVGSQRFGVIDDSSDYDFAMLAIDITRSDTHNYYKNHSMVAPGGEHIHWYLHEFEELILGEAYLRMVWAMSNILRGDSQETTLLMNEKWRGLIDFLNANGELILNYSLNKFTKQSLFIKEISTSETFKREFFSKHIYRYLLAWLLVSKIELTEEVKYYLGKIKRMNWQEPEYEAGEEFQGFLTRALLDIKNSVSHFNAFDEDYLEIEIENMLTEYKSIISAVQ